MEWTLGGDDVFARVPLLGRADPETVCQLGTSSADSAGKADVIIKVDRTVHLVWP